MGGLISSAKKLAYDRRFQITAVSAGASTAVCGTAGAAGGVIVGGAVGALVGIVPALFTFGLSIPIFAIVGGGAGLVVGAAGGATVGFVGGGAAGCVGASFGGPITALNFAKNKVITVFSSNDGT